MKGIGNLISFFENHVKLDSKIIPNVGGIYIVSFQYPYKLRSITFYGQTFVGICNSVKKPKNLMCLFSLRNVLNKDPVEFSFFLNSPLLRNLKLISYSKIRLYNKNKLYYLRNKKLAYSRV